MRMKPLDYMSFKNGILQDWVREAKYDYDIEKLGMVQQVLSLIQLYSVDLFLVLIRGTTNVPKSIIWDIFYTFKSPVI